MYDYLVKDTYKNSLISMIQELPIAFLDMEDVSDMPLKFIVSISMQNRVFSHAVKKNIWQRLDLFKWTK